MPIAPAQQTPQQSAPAASSGRPNLKPKPGMSYQEAFNYLTSQGVSAWQALQILGNDPNYGTIDEYNTRQGNQAEKAKQAEALGNVIGATGVALGAKYILNDAASRGSPELARALTRGSPTGDTYTYAQRTPQGSVVSQGTTGQGENFMAIRRPIPSETLDLDTLAAQQGQGGAGATQYQTSATQPTGTQSYNIPDQQYSLGETTTVQTNAGPREVPTELAKDTEFVQGTDWNTVGQGAFAALQAYQAYQAFKDKDYVGAGISGASAGLGAGAATYGAQSTAAQYLPYAGGAAALYGGYQTAKLTGAMPKSKQRDVKATTGGAAAGAAGGAAIGSQIGSGFGPIGMGIGAAIGAAAGYAGSKFGSSKGKGQSLRDSLRANLQEVGALDENYQGTLADGSKFDFGKDGSTLKWSNLDKVKADNQAAWDATSNSATAIAAYYKLTGQKNADVAGWLQNAAVSNANNDPQTALANMRHFAQSQGVDPTMIKANLDTALADNKINQSQYDQIMAGARDIYGERIIPSNVKPSANMSTEDLKKQRKQDLFAAGIDLSNMKYSDVYKLYEAGAISKEEMEGRRPRIR